MKIVFAVSAMESGGAERVVSLLSNEFAKRNFEVTILMLSTSKKRSFYSLDPKVNLTPLLNEQQSNVRFFSRVKIIKNYLILLLK